MVFIKIISLIGFSFALFIPTTFADEGVNELQISRAGDIEMSCGLLSKEATLMRDIIFTTQDLQNSNKMKSRGAAVAGTAASFLVGTVTGGIGIAAAGFLIDESFAGDAEATDKIQDTAEQRRSFVMGIYNAKGCHGPLDHALQSPDVLMSFDDIVKASTIDDIEPASGEPSTQYNQ